MLIVKFFYKLSFPWQHKLNSGCSSPAMAKAATSPSFPGCELSVAVPGGGHPQVPIASLLQSCAFVLLCLEVTRRAAALQGGWTELFKGSDLFGKQKGCGGAVQFRMFLFGVSLGGDGVS